ncbi:MAG: hypothetical protein C4567_09285, partial [Deltaproteobacteria bacterium]
SVPRMDIDLRLDVRQYSTIDNQSRLLVFQHPAKYEIGLKYATFAANADLIRKNAAHEFLTIVRGLTHLPPDTLTLELSEKINNLFEAHVGFNNFYNEPAHAKFLAAYIPGTGVIPDAVRAIYVKTLIMCRIGNGHGVCWAARAYYDELIERFQESEILAVTNLVLDSDVSSRLQFSECATNYNTICQQLRQRAVNQRTITALDRIINTTPQQLPNLIRTTEMRRILGVQ